MKRRMHNILQNDGKAFIVAVDQGYGGSCLPGLKDTKTVLSKCIEGGADGFLVSIGIASEFADVIGGKTLLLRADGGITHLNVNGAPFALINTVEEAIRVGADGILCMDFPGSTHEEVTAKNLGELVREGLKWNLPVGAEMLPRGFEFDKFKDLRTPENLIVSARIGCERGADFIKTHYTGDKASFKELVDSCYKPVFVLGGNARTEFLGFFQEMRDAMDAGAAGVIVGRNVWQHPTPDKMCAAIKACVHDHATPEQAVAILTK